MVTFKKHEREGVPRSGVDNNCSQPADADVIFILSGEDGSGETVESVINNPLYTETEAVKNGKVISLDISQLGSKKRI